MSMFFLKKFEKFFVVVKDFFDECPAVVKLLEYLSEVAQI
jgi:hypothetical protein